MNLNNEEIKMDINNEETNIQKYNNKFMETSYITEENDVLINQSENSLISVDENKSFFGKIKKFFTKIKNILKKQEEKFNEINTNIPKIENIEIPEKEAFLNNEEQEEEINFRPANITKITDNRKEKIETTFEFIQNINMDDKTKIRAKNLLMDAKNGLIDINDLSYFDLRILYNELVKK